MKIAFLGTSITKGTSYGGVTATQTFAHKIGTANGYAATDILNKGVNSDTSAGMLARLSTDILANSPAVCVVETGLNDWSTGVSIASFRASTAAIFAQLIAAGIKPVALTPSMQRGSTADFAGFKAYLQAFEDEANLAAAPVVDLYRELAAAYLYYPYATWNGLYADAVVHLSVAGHQFVADLAARPRFSGIFD
jgi:lysophospholipase L1-like esterase